MAVLREWRAEIHRALKDEYVEYVRATGVACYRATRGNLGASVAVRDLDADRAEIVTLSWWADAESLTAFAGPDIGRARYYPEDERYLLTRPERVQHYDATALVSQARISEPQPATRSSFSARLGLLWRKALRRVEPVVQARARPERAEHAAAAPAAGSAARASHWVDRVRICAPR